MPIGVPRIIYCWGEELPPQWTDIYNFIFRRRMVFLMQYLDDELCNQICGLLINIHMEDRSKELEKKEIEKSGIFKSAPSASGPRSKSPNSTSMPSSAEPGPQIKSLKKDKSMEDLLSSYSSAYPEEEDLAIDENYTLEQYTLQKITLEWLNWNAQFFDFSDEPYLFYLAEILSKDFSREAGSLQLPLSQSGGSGSLRLPVGSSFGQQPLGQLGNRGEGQSGKSQRESKNAQLDVYSPFRSIVNLAELLTKDPSQSLKNLHSSFGHLPNSINGNSSKTFNNTKDLLQQLNCSHKLQQKPGLAKLIGVLASKDFMNQNSTGAPFVGKGPKDPFVLRTSRETAVLNKALGQQNLRREYADDWKDNPFKRSSLSKGTKRPSNSEAYLFADAKNRNEYSKKGRAAPKKALQEEESKKVFVIINSFGGSVGNGITVHDALQFIKAGSLTLGLGVAASAASLVLAGGTISERYVTEGCHVMIHQPSGSINGQASDIWIDSQEIMKIRLDVAEIYSLSAHRPRHKILRDLDRDFYLTATETIHYGLADEIATNEVMHEIIEMTSKVWDYHDTKQQRLLETRDSASSGLNIETQN